MKKLFYIPLMLILGITACDEPGRDQLLPADTAIVELNSATTPTGSEGFLYLRDNTGAILPSGFVATLTGQQRSSATNINFEIDAASTAIEGIHFSVGSNSVSIPANASTAELPISIMPDNINAGEILSIIVNITSADVDVNPLYSTATHNIQILCPSVIDDTRTYTGVTIQGAFGATMTNPNVVVTKVSDNTYKLSSVDALITTIIGLPACGQESVIFQDICEELVIINGNPDGTTCLAWETNAGAGFGSGSYDAATGKFTLPAWDASNSFGVVVEFTPN